MDALMAALVACFACQLSDRLGWAASAQAVASGRPVAALLGVALALAVANALAGAGAALIAPLLTPNARALFLALALGSAALGGMTAPKPPVAQARLGTFAASLAAGIALGLGDRSQFLAAAFGVRSSPVFAAIGATLGGTAACSVAILGGPNVAARLRSRAVRLPIAGVLLIAGIAAALSAFRLL
jgi:Ca2+/H+ antiporter, TMEM165/GDT1 family